MPAIENKYIVTEIMNEMEQKNGSYNEDNQQFANAYDDTNSQTGRPVSYSNQLLAIIQNDPKLVSLINSHSSNGSKLKSLLAANDDALKRDLFDDPDVLPAFLYDYFHVRQPVAAAVSPIAGPMIVNERESHQSQLSSYGKEINHQSNNIATEFNFAKLIIGPLLAAIAFFLVTNTPILFYLGKLPYLGNLLISNKVVTSLALIMVLFMAGELLVNMIGLLE